MRTSSIGVVTMSTDRGVEAAVNEVLVGPPDPVKSKHPADMTHDWGDFIEQLIQRYSAPRDYAPQSRPPGVREHRPERPAHRRPDAPDCRRHGVGRAVTADSTPTICDRCYRPIDSGDPRLVLIMPTADGELRLGSYQPRPGGRQGGSYDSRQGVDRRSESSGGDAARELEPTHLSLRQRLPRRRPRFGGRT